MTTFTQKWAIAALLEPTLEGAEFLYTDFPLHVTLAGVFAIDVDGKVLAEKLTTVLADQPRIEVSADGEDYFGPNKEVVVMKLLKTSDLMNLYAVIEASLQQADAVFNEPQYEGAGYIPHSTHQKHKRLNAGDSVVLSSVSIIDLFPDGDGYKRRVFKTIELAALKKLSIVPSRQL